MSGVRKMKTKTEKEIEKLLQKMDKRVGMKAIVKDNMNPGMIEGYRMNSEYVEYLIAFDNNTEWVPEYNVVLLLGSKK